MKRRQAAIIALIVALSISSLPPSAGAASPPLLFGAYPQPTNGQTPQDAVVQLESTLGRKLAAVRVYDLWDTPFPTSFDDWLRDTGHIVALSVKALRTNNTRINWADIANAQPGSQLYNDVVGWANRVRDFGGPVWFIFNHEPEEQSNSASGTAQDFIAAWRKVVTIFRQQGVTNAKYVWVATSYAFARTDGQRAALWYPGDSYVDAIGADPYNWYNCRPGINNAWRSLQQIIEPMRDFGLAHPDKDMILTEFGSVEDPATPERKAQWFNAAQQLFKQPGWEQYTATLYYNTRGKSTHPNCVWLIDTSQSSLDAFRLLANDPVMSGPSAIFSDDFSSGSFSAWTATVRLTIDSTQSSIAPPSARAQVSSQSAYAYRNLGAIYTSACMSVNVNAMSLGGNTVDLFRLRTASDGPISRAFVSASGVLYFRSDASGVQKSSGVSLGAGWHNVELCGTVGSASTWDLYRDGVKVLGGWVANTGTTPIGRIQIGDNAAKTFTINWDDVVLDTSPG